VAQRLAFLYADLQYKPVAPSSLSYMHRCVKTGHVCLTGDSSMSLKEWFYNPIKNDLPRTSVTLKDM
jgi:hypothetical protein